MGLQIGDIISKKEINFKDLKSKTIIVDAFNIIYQFLTTIRQRDGTPLKDSEGRITSHLSGLFYRNMKLILEGINLIYVFDGEAPQLKVKTQEKRKKVKEEMKERYEEALEKKDVEGMEKYSKRTVSLDKEKIEESKRLLEAMGVMIVQAPGEGEAQASWMVKQGQGYAVSSQDYDCLMFEAPKLIQNLGMARRRKTISGYKEVFPQMIKLPKVKEELELNQEQLICLGILCGTDYNPKGVKGLGPKKSLKLVKEYKSKEEIFKSVEENEKKKVGSENKEDFGSEKQKSAEASEKRLDFDWKIIYNEIKNPNINKEVKIEFPERDKNKIKDILMEHDFSEKRIDNQLEKLKDLKKEKEQKTLF